jgi:hypothetical protein
MMKHGVRKEAARLLCEAVQGEYYHVQWVVVCLSDVYTISSISTVSIISTISTILTTSVTDFTFAARIEDDEDFELGEGDSWTANTGRANVEYPLDPLRWWNTPGQLDDEVSAAGRCMGIECNIWARAKRRRDITHQFSGGGKQNLGYAAIRWQLTLQGAAPGLGAYREITVLAEKTAKFLFEYHHDIFQSLNLPHLPNDRSQIDVHKMLSPLQVSAFHMKHLLICYVKLITHINHINHINHIGSHMTSNISVIYSELNTYAPYWNDLSY